MKVAIVGGGISGLATAYQLTRQQIDWTLFEASDRLGGIVETIHAHGFVIEGGPDSWVTEKPWARDLALELGLGAQIVSSNDQWRRTYVLRGTERVPELVPIPDGMRMMVPSRWGPLLESPLFTWQGRLAFLREPKRAEELKAAAPATDESVDSFVRRHFGAEVADSVAAPLLSAVFGGDSARLSVRAVMPAFVRMEAEQGSLIHAVQQAAARRGDQPAEPIFTTLIGGLQTLVDAMVATFPAGAVRLQRPVSQIAPEEAAWRVEGQLFDAVVLATPAQVTRGLLAPIHEAGARIAELQPARATSAIVVAFAFDRERAARMRIPRGFGFVVPPGPGLHRLLACTFVDQKFPGRAPEGAVLLRAFFGGPSADTLLQEEDHSLVTGAREQLARVLGPLPEALFTLVRRWPQSMPQYEVGHLERVKEIESLLPQLPGLHLVGNAYHGVGLPDLIRQGMAAARLWRL